MIGCGNFRNICYLGQVKAQITVGKNVLYFRERIILHRLVFFFLMDCLELSVLVHSYTRRGAVCPVRC